MTDRRIHRVHRTAGFTTIPNSLLRDTRLSFKARGIMAMILSNVDEWEADKGWVEQQGTEGREAIKSAYRELEWLGYVRFERLTDPDTGQAAGARWHYYDTPVDPADRTNITRWDATCEEERRFLDAQAAKPTPTRTTGSRMSGSRTSSEDHGSENHGKETPLPPEGDVGGATQQPKDTSQSEPPKAPRTPPADSEEFKKFWMEYPRKDAKDAARRAFRKLNPTGQQLARILGDIEARKSSQAWLKDGGQFIPMPSTYLNQRRWEDEGVQLAGAHAGPAEPVWKQIQALEAKIASHPANPESVTNNPERTTDQQRAELHELKRALHQLRLQPA